MLEVAYKATDTLKANSVYVSSYIYANLIQSERITALTTTYVRCCVEDKDTRAEEYVIHMLKTRRKSQFYFLSMMHHLKEKEILFTMT